jgi:hypothetical protein
MCSLDFWTFSIDRPLQARALAAVVWLEIAVPAPVLTRIGEVDTPKQRVPAIPRDGASCGRSYLSPDSFAILSANTRDCSPGDFDRLGKRESARSNRARK